MFAFGIFGYLMRKFDYPAAPLLLALVLGPIMEKNLKLALKMSHGSVAIFFQRPIALILLALIVLSLAWPLLVARLSSGRGAIELPVADE
jgi:putative tricarboxylic transport membrane protein